MSEATKTKVFTIKIWNGETLYPRMGLPMTPDQVVKNYGFVLSGAPIALLLNADGVVEEINTLSDLMNKLEYPLPDNYKDVAKSPVLCSLDPQTGILSIEPTNEPNPLLDAAVQTMEDNIPAWQKKQFRIQQVLDYSKSNLLIAAAIKGLDVSEGFDLYKDVLKLSASDEPAQLLGSKSINNSILVETTEA